MQVLDWEAVASTIFPVMHKRQQDVAAAYTSFPYLDETFHFTTRPIGYVPILEHVLHCASRFLYYLDTIGAWVTWCTWCGPDVKRQRCP